MLATDTESLAREGHTEGWASLAGRAAMARTWGDCYGHALVATGRAEAMLDPVLALWDSAALLPIIEEAGGVFTDWTGRAVHNGASGIATNAALAKEIRELLGACGLSTMPRDGSCQPDPMAQ